MRKIVFGLAILFIPAIAQAACPEVTVADDQGLTGQFRQQFELAEFEAAANCKLNFKENPAIAELNARIIGNPGVLPPVEDRLPQDPLVVAPYDEIGRYGGIFDGMSNSTESGTGELLSMRQVNLVRFSDDLETIVPNIAKSWTWNEDFTELTFKLRLGHRWSDGEPFTAHDILFWYNDMMMNTNIIEKPRGIWLAGGEPLELEALDDHTVVFRMAAPRPGLLVVFADDYAQPFQPKHFLGQFHPDINPDADALAQAAGFKDGYEVIAAYYGGSDWKDIPTLLLKDPAKIEALPGAVIPTLESYIIVNDVPEGRRLVANPFFHMVDTAGNQLPYINEIDEKYIGDNEVRVLRMINGEVDYKGQTTTLPDLPTLIDNQEKGNYEVLLRPQNGMFVIGFNFTADDEEKRAIFSNRDFRVAMSRAINRAEINSVATFDLGRVRQYVGFDPVPNFATDDQVNYAIDYAPDEAAATLDAIGLVDQNGDGFRDLPSGRPLALNIRFASQGTPSIIVELAAQDWNAVGIKTTIKEVTSDEYRAAQSANELDVHLWRQGETVPSILGSAEDFIVPFGSYFSLRNGILWARYRDSNGAEGLEPPAWTSELEDLIHEWQQHLPGSAESNELGHRAIDIFQEAFVFTSLSESPAPVYRSLKLRNFEPTKMISAYRHIYPYRPHQWWLTE